MITNMGGCALSDSSAHWVETYADPCGRRSVYPGPALIPDGAVPQAAPARFAFAETVIPPFANDSTTTENKVYSMLVLQAPFFRSLGYVVVNRNSKEFTAQLVEEMQHKLGYVYNISDITYPNWLGFTIEDGEYQNYVTSISPSILSTLEPPSKLGVSGDVSQFRDVGRGMVCYFNAPDLLNQGTVVAGQFNFNVSQHTPAVEGLGESVKISAQINSPPGAQFTVSSLPAKLEGWTGTWAPGITSPGYVADTEIRSPGGTLILSVGDSWVWFVATVPVGLTLVLRNQTTTTDHIVGSALPSGQTVIGVVWYAIDIENTTVVDSRYNAITMPPITQADLVQQDPNNGVQLMKQSGGIYMPLRVFQPVYNMQNSAGFAPFAFLTRESQVETVSPTGYGDSYDLNFAIGVINMQSIPYIANPLIKAINYREIVTTSQSIMGAFLVRTGEDDALALEVARTLTTALNHSYPADYNGLGKLFGIVMNCIRRLPMLGANAMTIRRCVTDAMSCVKDSYNIATDRNYKPPTTRL